MHRRKGNRLRSAATLLPYGEYLQRAWTQSVYPLAQQMGVPISLPQGSPQPHSHLAFEGYQFAKEHGKGNESNHSVLEAFFVGKPAGVRLHEMGVGRAECDDLAGQIVLPPLQG